MIGTKLPLLLESYLGRKIDFQNEIIIVCEDAVGTKIKEWNAPESQPTKIQLQTFWDENKEEILKDQDIKQLNNKHRSIFMDKLFEQYKLTDEDYKAELQGIING